MNAAVMLLIDGRFPAGGHTNSAGVEAAVQVGDVHDDATLERYLRGRLATTGIVDAAFAARAHGVVDATSLDLLDREYSARVMSPALRSASRRFGRQMLRAGRSVWSTPALDLLAATDDGPHQPLVLGALVAAAGGGPFDAAALTMHHLSAAVSSAAIRLLGLDPMAIAAVQARVGLDTDRRLHEPGTGVACWLAAEVTDLPAAGGSLTEILGQSHASFDGRLFVA